MQQPAYPHSKGSQDTRFPQRSRNRGSRPVASVNLGRLADTLNIDVLSACLGLSEGVLNKIIQGHDVAEDYQVHIESRFKEAGVPIDWLRRPDMNMRGDYLNALGKLAATSENKAPTRRHNFQTLVNAFNGQTAMVAEMLDMNEASVRGVYDGRLELGDERFTHLNPRLMRAGFPNGWLDKAGAILEHAWLPQLEALVSADEQEAEEQRAADAALRGTTPPVSTSAPVPALSTSLVANDTEASATLIAALPGNPTDQTPAPAEPRPVLTLPAQPPPISEVAASPAPTPLEVESRQQPLFNSTAANDQQAERSAEPSESQSPPALGDKNQIQDISKEMTSMATAQKATSAKPTAGAARPTQPSRVIPRGALGAGRSIGRPPTSPASAAAKKTGKTVLVKSKSAPVTSAAVEKPLPQSRVKPSKASAVLSRADTPNTRGGKTPVTKTVSMARAAALEQLFDGARRGAKSALWVHLLKESLALGGNMRRGTNLMRDEMADQITEHLQLPIGWLDNPVFPPPSLAEWVTNPDVPLPGDAENPRRLGRPPKNSKTPFARAPAPDPTAQLGQPAAAEPAASTPAPAAPAPAPVVRPAAPSVRQSTAPAPVPAQTTGTGTFVWTPSAGAPVAAPSQLMQALGLVLNQSALEGRFTDADARKLIAMLMTT